MDNKDTYFKLRVSNIDRACKDAVIITLEPPKGFINDFMYQAGQYLTISHQYGNKKQVVRSYSICSSPHSLKSDKSIQIGVRLVPDGIMSTYLNTKLKVGDFLSSLTPRGNFTIPSNSNYSTAVFIGAGSGITPLFPLIIEHLEKDNNNTAILIYQNKDSIRMMLRDRILFLKNQYLNRLQWINFFSTPIDNSITNKRIEASDFTNLIKAQLIPDAKDLSAYYLCGPTKMVANLSKGLIELGVEERKIKEELFTNPNQAIVLKQVDKAPKDVKLTIIINNLSNQISLERLEGKEKEKEKEKTPTTILEIGRAEGLDLPYSCKAGVCSTCKARLIKGSVIRLIDHVLTQEEKDKGYILTCQAIPDSKNITVSYDEAH